MKEIHTLFKEKRQAIFYWGKSIILSVSDQGVFSGANLIINILLARWLSPEIFGDFSVLYSFFLLISSVQNSVALEPMSVFGLSKHKKNLRNYFDFLFILQFFTLLVIGIILIFSSLFIKESGFKQALLALGMVLPLILNLWFLRRAFYLKEQIWISIACNLIYAVVVIIGIIILNQAEQLNAMSAFLTIGVASFIASLIAIFVLKINIVNGVHVFFTDEARGILTETWDYCKWVLLTIAVNWIASLSIIPLLKIFSGSDQAGAYRSIQVLYMPIQQTLTAFQLFFLPWISRAFLEKGKRYLHKTIRKVMTGSVIFTLVYLIFIHFSGKWIISLFYDSEFYNQFTWALPYFSIAVLVGIISQIGSIGLRAINCPATIFYSKSVAALFILVVGIYLIWKMSFLGGLIVAIGSVIFEGIAILFFYSKEILHFK